MLGFHITLQLQLHEGNDDDDDAGNRSGNLVCPGRAGEPVHLRKPLLLLLTKLANGIQYSILSQRTQKYHRIVIVMTINEV